VGEGQSVPAEAAGSGGGGVPEASGSGSEARFADLKGMARLTVGVALWHGGLPIDVLPAEGFFDVQLGEEHSAWPVDL